MDFYTMAGLLPNWLRELLAYCGGLAIIISTGYLIIKLLKSVLAISALVNRINELIPVLFKMADQFENNGGASLRDAIDELNRKMAEQSVIIKNVQENAINAFALARDASELAKFVASEIPAKVEVCNTNPIPVKPELDNLKEK